MSDKDTVLEFYPDAYCAFGDGTFKIRATYNGIRFNLLHGDPQETEALAWKAVVDRMESEATK